jgi:predicted dehydrogenase
MIKVGIIGAGGMGIDHAACISKVNDVKIAAISDINSIKAETLAKTYNAEVIDTDAVINSNNIDVVFICVPTSSHANLVIKSAKAGKHVFVEKPLARTLNEGREMLQATKKVKFMVGHILRFFPEYSTIKRIVDKGTIGKPGIVRTTRAGKFPGAWYLAIEHGAGVVLDLLIHDIDFLRWCFGDVKRVYAKGLIYKKLSDIDYALVTIRFKNGIIAHVEGSWAHKLWRTRVEIAGDKGIINYDNIESIPLKVETKENGQVLTTSENPIADNPLFLEDNHFFECIKSGKQPLISGEDAYKSLEVSLSALESIEKDEVINIG